MIKQWMLILLSLLVIGSANAETRYVMDVIYIGVRDSPEEGASQVAVIKSGAKLEVLDVLDEQVKVRTEKGETGWVKDRYLSSEPIAALLLESANKRIESLSSTNSRLNKELSELKNSLRMVEKENKTISGKFSKVSKENARINEIAKKPLELSRQTAELSDQVVSLGDQVKTLTAANRKLQDDAGQDWFLAGAGVVIIGILLGLVVPRMRLKRKSEWA